MATEPQIKICPRCGANFPCSAPGRCWCMELPPLEKVDAESDCLCPKCLSAATLNSQPSTLNPSSGFTLVELLVTIAIIAILASLLLPALTRSKVSAQSVRCVNNLHQLSIAAQLYWDDNNGNTFPYHTSFTNNGDIYWFGWIATGDETTRAFDAHYGALYPYLAGRGVELCPALNYSADHFKLKAEGATYGYGYNLKLSPPNKPPLNIRKLSRLSGLALLADAAQINTWQAPASPDNPMLEEWYYVDDNATGQQPNGHFRHNQRANVLFCDGHVGREQMVPGSLDNRLPAMMVGDLRHEIILP